MVLPKEPRQPKDTKLQYYAYRYDKLFLVLNYILCPFTCGSFYCWTMPRDQVFSDLRREGLPVHERMSDMHFARQGRKLSRRTSLSMDRSGGKIKNIFKHQKKTSNQPLSPLFTKLPYEIRSQIFKQVLLDTGAVFIYAVPIAYNRRSFQKLRVLASDLEFSTPPGLGDFNEVNEVSSNRFVRRSSVGAALLRTCRLVYKEALTILYAQTRFVFENPRHLSAFSHSVPRTHFEHIRSIRLDFSEISDAYPSGHRTFVTPFLEPMQEYLSVIRVMRQIRDIYVGFRVAKHTHMPRSKVDALLEDMREYQKRIAGATTEKCEVHLLVFFWKKLIFERTERGLLKSGDK